jgi:hypothetical protein
MPSEISVAATPQSSTAQGAGSQPGPGMQEMMKMHERMMAEMKAGDSRLEALLKDMNAATADAKVAAMAAVVNELVQQHRAMHGRMGTMHQQMMTMMGGRGGMMRR